MKRIVSAFVLLVLFLAGCGKPVQLPAESRNQMDTTAATKEDAPAGVSHVSYKLTEWEADHVILADGSRVEVSELLEEGRISEPFLIRFYDNGFVYVDYLEITDNRGVWIGYNYSDEGALTIDFPTDTVRSYTLVSASAEAIEIRNEQGETYHFVPVPYSG